MISGEFFYKIFYFCLFFYAVSTCFRNCLDHDDPPSEGQTEDNNDDNNRDLEINDSAERRRELVLGRLEYRKILAPSSVTELKSKDNKKKKTEDTGELDLEKGEGTTSTSKGKVKDKNKDKDNETETETKKTANNDDDDAPISSNENRIDSSVRSFISSSMSVFNLVGAGTSSHNENCCSICLEPYAVGDTVARLKKKQTLGNNYNGEDSNDTDGCNHWFHEDCILQWLQNHDDCPLCRKNMINT